MIKERVSKEELKATLRAHPTEFNMGAWIDQTPCGTSFCIGGWALVLAGYQLKQNQYGHIFFDGDDEVDDIEEAAAELLGLSYPNTNLFYRSGWPSELEETSTETPEEAIEKAIKAIDYFID